MIKRYLTELIISDLKDKIVLVSGQDKLGKQLFILKIPK